MMRTGPKAITIRLVYVLINFSIKHFGQNFPNETLASVDTWKTFGEGNNGWQRISSQADLGGIKFEENFHADDCDFWDGLDVY